MANCSESMSQQAAEVNMQNLKTILDRFTSLMAQGAEDNQSDARKWNSISLRRAENAATIDHLANVGLLQISQTGATENQQTTSPAGTAAAEAIKGGIGVSAEQVAANIAALGDVVVKFADAVAAVLLTASGGASTPSQTQAKPAA